jgi:hypothetical protein
MKSLLIDETPTTLEISLRRTFPQRLFTFAGGLAILAAGAALLLILSPQAEFLRIVREDGHMECTAGESLPGWKAVTRQTLLTEKPVTASVEAVPENGGTHYRMLLQTEEERLYFGGTKHDQHEAGDAVSRVNEFLESGEGSVFEYRENFWWWSPGPFLVLGFTAGLFFLFLSRQTEVWIFDRCGNQLTRELRLFFPICLKRRPLYSVRAARVIEVRDAGGDALRCLRLSLDAGETIDMATVAGSSEVSAHLDGCAERITGFLLERSVRLDSLPEQPAMA